MRPPPALLAPARRAHAQGVREAESAATAMGPDIRALVAPLTAALSRSTDYASARRALVALASRPTPPGLARRLTRLLDRSYTAGEDSAAAELAANG